MDAPNLSPVSPVPGTPPPRHREPLSWSRRIRYGVEIVLLVLGARMAVQFGIVSFLGTAEERHFRQLDRIADWLERARASPPAGLDADGWSFLLSAPGFALYNPLCRPRWVPTEKVRALADELDATQASDLATAAGVFRLIGRMEEVCPNAKDYSAFETARKEFPDEAKAAAQRP